MKKAILAAIIIAIIVAAGVVENFYVEKTFDKLDERIDELNQLVKEEDKEKCLERLNSMMDWWEKKRTTLESIAYSPDMRQLSVAMGETKGSLECDDFQNALSKTESMVNLSANIREIINFNVHDII